MSARKWPPSILFHRSSGQSRIRVNGDDVYLGPHGSEESRRRYAETIARLLVEGKAAPARKTDTPYLTVNDVLDQFDRHAAETCSERGREYDQFQLVYQPLRRLYGTTAAAEFDADKLEDLQRALATGSWMSAEDRKAPNRKPTGGLCRRIVNRRIGKVRHIWQWAERKKLVPTGAFHALKAVAPLRATSKLARSSPRPQATTLEELKRILPYCRADIAAMLLVQWWTGCRSGEVRSLRVGDVTLAAGVRTYRPREHKTDYLGEERTIAVGPKAWSVLGPWLVGKTPDDYAFPSPKTGAAWTRDGYCHAVRAAAKKAGLPGWHPYRCRHGARMRIGAAAGDEAARAVLGHKTISTTEHYGQLDAALAARVQAKLG